MRTHSRVLGVVALLALAGSGCASTQNDAAAGAAHRFYDALSHHDAAGACAMLGQATRSSLESQEKEPCAKAIGKEDIPHVGAGGSVETFGTMAKVTWPGESAFLSRFRTGWRVVAAGCKPQPARPYDCEIQGS